MNLFIARPRRAVFARTIAQFVAQEQELFSARHVDRLALHGIYFKLELGQLVMKSVLQRRQQPVIVRIGIYQDDEIAGEAGSLGLHNALAAADPLALLE